MFKVIKKMRNGEKMETKAEVTIETMVWALIGLLIAISVGYMLYLSIGHLSKKSTDCIDANGKPTTCQFVGISPDHAKTDFNGSN